MPRPSRRRSGNPAVREIALSVAFGCAGLAAQTPIADVVRSFAVALAEWFPEHAQVMDQGLARWLTELRTHGYLLADRATDHTGRTAGLYVIILDPMLPSWERGEGDSAVSPLRAKIKDSREDAFASWWRLWPAELGPTRCDSRRAKGVAATWAGQ